MRNPMNLPSGRLLLLLALLLASAASAAVPPDLAESARQIEQLPSTRGQGSESERLKRFFDLYWRTQMLEGPELATYIGYPGLDDRLGDASPEMLALDRRIVRDERAALASIDRARLTPPDQVDYDLARWRVEQAIEGEAFHAEYMPVHQLSGIQQELPQLLASMPTRSVQDYENRLARLRQVPRAVDQTLALLDQGLKAGITPPKVTLRDVPAQFASLLTEDPAKSPVLESFQEIPETIPAADRERLRREAAQLFQSRVAPALRKLHDFLVRTYIPGARETIAM